MRVTLVSRAMLVVTVLCASVVAMSQHSEAANPNGAALRAGRSPADEHYNEDWDGRRTTEGKSQSIVLHVTRSKSEGGVTVDLQDFGASGIPASKFKMADGRFHFELVGDASTAVFDGTISGETIQGSWKEGDRAGSFELKRVHQAHPTLREEEVSFKNGVVKLAGSLLLPQGHGPVPAIIFVQGAGPETRFASRFLAEFFVKRGVAALIYDKRGTGASSGDWKHSSFDDLAGDVMASASLLTSRPEIDPARIGLMGSSQGGWIVPMAAIRTPNLAFVIVKSAAAVTPEEQELARVETQMRAEGDSPADIKDALALYSHAIAYARDGQGWDALANEIAADSQKKWAFFDKGTPKDYWFFDQIRLNFGHDPIPVLQEVKSPLLVIFGGEDDDGPPLQNSLGRLLEAMRGGGKSAKLDIFPAAGHDLRVIPAKGQAWDFPRFAPGYLESLASWVKLQTK